MIDFLYGKRFRAQEVVENPIHKELQRTHRRGRERERVKKT